MEDANSEYTSHIGNVALLWNGINMMIFSLFVGLTGLSNRHAGAAYYAIKGDAIQHRMTRDLGLSILSGHTDASQELVDQYKKTFTRIEKAGEIRNGIVHASIAYDGEHRGLVDPFNAPSKLSARHGLFDDLDAQSLLLVNLAQDLNLLIDRVAEKLDWPKSFFLRS